MAANVSGRQATACKSWVTPRQFTCKMPAQLSPRGIPVAEEVSQAKVLVALETVLGWPPLARSPQLVSLLSYIVRKTLDGEEAGIKAYAIAVDVFGRPAS